MIKCPQPFCDGKAKPAESGGMICQKCGQWF